MKKPRQRVKRVTQSPLNPQRWCLELECGHDEWVTSKTRPKRAKAECSTCFEKAFDASR